MKKNAIVYILMGIIAMTVCGCGNKEPEKVENTTNTINIETEFFQEKSATEENTQKQSETDEFTFADFANLEFYFSSGAGGWRTIMTIAADGSFSGEYSDGELGAFGENYPKGTRYQCNFTGQFTQPVKVNEYTYSMQIREISYAEEAGTEEIKDGIRFCYSDAYGLDNAENILIYLPGAPLTELSEEFRVWVGYYNLSDVTDTGLPFYALNNEAQQYGFSSYNIIDNLKENITYTEEWAASLENSIKNDLLTQMEYNEKTQQLYEVWDSALNTVWDVLKRTLDADTMRLLTVEELEWIALKEQEVAKAGAEYEGGSIQSMIMNQKAAEMTKVRVYELLELLD